jgi:hypothetical protein
MQVGPNEFRVESCDRNTVTCHKFFVCEFSYTAADGSDEDSRWTGELQSIHVVSIGGQEKILMRGTWYSATATSIDKLTETPRLDLSKARVADGETYVEAKAISNQVLVCPLPVRAGARAVAPTAIVLDRYFDTQMYYDEDQNRPGPGRGHGRGNGRGNG